MTKEYSIAGHSRLAKANLDGLHLFKELTDKSRDSCKFSTILTSTGPTFQECTGSCHDNIPAPKAVSSNLRLTDGLTGLVRIG